MTLVRHEPAPSQGCRHSRGRGRPPSPACWPEGPGGAGEAAVTRAPPPGFQKRRPASWAANPRAGDKVESCGTFVNWERWAGPGQVGRDRARGEPLLEPHAGLPCHRPTRDGPPHRAREPLSGPCCMWLAVPHTVPARRERPARSPRWTLRALVPVSPPQAAWASLSTGLRPSALLAEASEGKSGTPRECPAVITGQAPGGGAPVLRACCRQGAAQAVGPAATCSSAASRLWCLVLRGLTQPPLASGPAGVQPLCP